MGITAIVLNFYLTRKRKMYYPISIGAAGISFIIWEMSGYTLPYPDQGALFKPNQSTWP